MLDSIRKKKDNLIYSFVILLTVAVMALWGVGQMDGNQDSGGAAAWVNGDVISKREFQQELEYRMLQYQQMLGGQYDEKFLMALQVPQRTLEELVQAKLLAQQAKQMDIVVPDRVLADHIRSLPYYQKNGKFDAELYSKIPNPGVEERRQRERLQLSKLQSYMSDRVKMTPTALRDSYTLRDSKANLEYAAIDFDALAAKQPVAAKAVDDFLKSAPETELKAYYDAHLADYTEKAQVNLHRIRIGVPFQASEAQKTAAKSKIEEIAKEVTPKNFAEVAKKRSDDEVAKKGGDAGWVKRGSLEPPLEAALDKLELNEVSAPIETGVGYFLLMVTGKKDQVVKPLAEVKRDVAEKIVGEKSRKDFVENKRKEWDTLLAQGKSVEPELKKLKVDVKKTGPFSIGAGYIPNIGQSDALMDALFELTPEKPVGNKLHQVQDKYYYVKLASFEPAKPAEFAKNAEAVEKAVVTSLQSEIFTKWLDRLKKGSKIQTEVKFQDQPETAIQ